jgi:hypothetical protein
MRTTVTLCSSSSSRHLARESSSLCKQQQQQTDSFSLGYDPGLTEMRVDCRDGKFVVLDLGSGHGTLVNGSKVSHAVIH